VFTDWVFTAWLRLVVHSWVDVVDVQPGCRLLVVLLAVIKLGLAYVPVDSRCAVNRVKYILQAGASLSADRKAMLFPIILGHSLQATARPVL